MVKYKHLFFSTKKKRTDVFNCWYDGEDACRQKKKEKKRLHEKIGEDTARIDVENCLHDGEDASRQKGQ